MDWQKIRELCPRQWGIVEAIKAYTEKGKRIIPEMRVVGTFGDDWRAAWERYKELHRENKWIEYYYLHTDREELDISVMDAFLRKLELRVS
jgi:hypothetical protein